jgi:hypothetical protein
MGTDERMPIVDFGFLIGENGQIGVDEAVGEWMVKVWAKGGEVALSWELLDHLIRAAPPAVVPTWSDSEGSSEGLEGDTGE